jgi:MOSC domain-containing protein
VAEAVVQRSGALEHDSEFALFDDKGKWINGKRDPRVHLIRTAYDLHQFTVTVHREDDLRGTTFHLLNDRSRLEQWLSDFLGLRIHMRRATEVGFPDDMESPGPTVISSTTLKEIGSWFNIPDADEIGLRFRANIHLNSPAAFWEDRLFGKAGEVVEFRIGDIVLHGVNPCQRCVVPSRDSRTAAGIDGFQQQFAAMRQATLPTWLRFHALIIFTE